MPVLNADDIPRVYALNTFKLFLPAMYDTKSHAYIQYVQE